MAGSNEFFVCSNGFLGRSNILRRSNRAVPARRTGKSACDTKIQDAGIVPRWRAVVLRTCANIATHTSRQDAVRAEQAPPLQFGTWGRVWTVTAVTEWRAGVRRRRVLRGLFCWSG